MENYVRCDWAGVCVCLVNEREWQQKPEHFLFGRKLASGWNIQVQTTIAHNSKLHEKKVGREPKAPKSQHFEAIHVH